MKEVKVLYMIGTGWVAEVPYAITPRHLTLLGQRALRIQEQRLFDMRGDERKWAEARVQELRENKIQQRVVGREGNSRGDIDVLPPIARRDKVISHPSLTPGGQLVKG